MSVHGDSHSSDDDEMRLLFFPGKMCERENGWLENEEGKCEKMEKESMVIGDVAGFDFVIEMMIFVV